ncbi:TonB-dependent receptor [Maricurvus nonylphenolicus]|uniref:TonB-dependent receptor n=1 Tax=Maricurvus nonylphenolicus TaxID=1008307 RepID=UPI0036F2F37A
MKKFTPRILSLACSLAATGYMSHASAEGFMIEEVVVTAQRRAESLEDVPIAVSAFSGQDLQRAGMDDASDLVGLTPGFNGNVVSSSQPILTMRGVGSNDFTIGNDPALGVYVDEVYVGRSAGSVVNLFDAAQVEVLKGPQGTLFGRNTTAGAISITRAQPEAERSGSVELRVGNHGYQEARFIFNDELTENTFARIGVLDQRRDGFVSEDVSGKDMLDTNMSAIKAAIRHEGDRFDYTVTVDWSEDDQDAAVYRTLLDLGSGFVKEKHAVSDIADEQGSKREVMSVTGKGHFQLSDDYELTSISSWRKYDLEYLEDTDATPMRLLHFGVEETSEIFSQEFRLNATGENVDWFVGLSISYEDVEATGSVDYSEEVLCILQLGATCEVALGAPGFVGSNVTELNSAEGEYWNYAIFGDVKFAVGDHTNVTVGLRYSYDDKEMDVSNPIPANAVVAPSLYGLSLLPNQNIFLVETAGTESNSDTWSQFQPRFVIDHSLNADTLVYASASMGYKSGGFNILVPAAGSFEPEEMLSYEIGVKGSLMDRRLVYDAAIFHYVYDELQVQVIDVVSITRNAAEAKGYGFESSLRFKATERLSVSSTLAYLDAEYDTFVVSGTEDFTGNDLARSPEYTASVNLSYDLPLGDSHLINFNLTAVYTDDQYLLASNAEESLQEDYTTVDVEATLISSDESYFVSLFVNNLEDVNYINQTQMINDFGLALVQDASPRYYGLRAGYNF